MGLDVADGILATECGVAWTTLRDRVEGPADRRGLPAVWLSRVNCRNGAELAEIDTDQLMKRDAVKVQHRSILRQSAGMDPLVDIEAED